VDERVRQAFQRMSGISPERAQHWPSCALSEAEWLVCSDPTRMLDVVVPGRASDRKLRLFACACCRHIWHLLPEPACENAVELAEQYADGRATATELAAVAGAFDELWDRYYTEEADGTPGTTAFLACIAAGETTSDDAPRRVPGRWDRYIPARTWAPASAAAASQAGATSVARAAEEAAVCDLLRDVIGNPFLPVPFNPAWRTDTAITLARQMYESREFSAMPILADALQDAGCDNEDILNHCRAETVHVRGCWGRNES
jgi:hypothetical protein